MGSTDVDVDCSFVVDSIKVELDTLVVPFAGHVEFGPEPGVLDTSIFSDRSLNAWVGCQQTLRMIGAVRTHH